MKKVIVALLILIPLILYGCGSAGLLAINSMARFGDYVLHRDIPYGEGQAQRLDIYLPEGIEDLDKSSLATVVFFYGGCWGACSGLEKNDYRFVAEAFTANNVIAVIVDYRKYPDFLFPAIMADARDATRWVGENIGRYGGNPGKVFLMGHSAGAHMASLLVYDETYLGQDSTTAIKGFIGLAGPYDFLPFTESYQPALFAPPESYAQTQPINFVDGTEPPALLMYGNDDIRVRRHNITSLAAVIKSKAGRVETRFYDGVDHPGLIGALSIPVRSSKPVMQDILLFVSD